MAVGSWKSFQTKRSSWYEEVLPWRHPWSQVSWGHLQRKLWDLRACRTNKPNDCQCRGERIWCVLSYASPIDHHVVQTTHWKQLSWGATGHPRLCGRQRRKHETLVHTISSSQEKQAATHRDPKGCPQLFQPPATQQMLFQLSASHLACRPWVHPWCFWFQEQILQSASAKQARNARTSLHVELCRLSFHPQSTYTMRQDHVDFSRQIWCSKPTQSWNSAGSQLQCGNPRLQRNFAMSGFPKKMAKSRLRPLQTLAPGPWRLATACEGCRAKLPASVGIFVGGGPTKSVKYHGFAPTPPEIFHPCIFYHRGREQAGDPSAWAMEFFWGGPC